MSALSLCLGALLSSSLAPGFSPQEPQGTELETLLQAMARAHRGDNPALHGKGFAATLQITPIRTEDQQITITTDIRFSLDPLRIRYKVDEGGKRIERGRDPRGDWVRLSADEPPVSLAVKEYEKDREQLRRELRLARQLLRFLDPEEVVRKFGTPPELGHAALELGQGRTIACQTITGRTDAFPLYTQSGDERPAELRLWIETATHRLVQLQAFPLDTNGKPATEGELVLMPEHKAQGGLLLPDRLIFLRVATQPGTKDQQVPIAKLRLQVFQLDPPFETHAFDRNQPW